MSGYSLDANILIDSLLGHDPAQREIMRIAASGARMWVSRMAWIEVLSKGNDAVVREAIIFYRALGSTKSTTKFRTGLRLCAANGLG